MMRIGDFIIKQCKAMLENKQQALIYAVIFAILPFTSWLSVALMSLVTLRKGARSGFDVLLPALVIHSVPLMLLVPLSSALINALVTYVPCYFAALSLRRTEKWQVVFGVLLLQAFLGCLLIQFLVPDLIVEQFNHFKTILMQYQELANTKFDVINSLILAQLFFGIQILSVIVSGLISLMFARSIQAKLFLPGGFRNELMAFRSGRFAFLVFIGISLGFYYEIPLAINIFPLLLCYFLSTGLGLLYFICFHKRQGRLFILLLVFILLKPIFVLSAYIIIGLLDSLFNFRSYLQSRVREST